MADLYPYVIASLPMLHFGMKPPYAYEQFLALCRRQIPGRDLRLLRDLPHPADYPAPGARHPVVRQYIAFDTALRNELARIRAAGRHLDPAAYIRPAGGGGLDLSSAVAAAIRQVPPADAEKNLDLLRWKALEDLAVGHSLDLPVLIVHALQLRILLRWEDVRGATGAATVERALGHGKGDA